MGEVCECGHMMSEAVNLLNRNARKRKAPYRPNSISSEWIGLSENAHMRVTSSKKPRMMSLLKNGDTKIVRRSNKRTKTNTKIKALKDVHNSNNNDNIINDNNNNNNNINNSINNNNNDDNNSTDHQQENRDINANDSTQKERQQKLIQ